MLHLSREMYTCWGQYLEGEADLVGDWSSNEGVVYCGLCSKTIFPKDAEVPTFGEFGNYLNTKKIPGKDQTFAEFFSKVEGSYVSIGGNGINQKDTMDLDKPIYSVLTVTKIDSEDFQEYQNDRAVVAPDGVVFGTTINPGDDFISGDVERVPELIGEAALVGAGMGVAEMTAGALGLAAIPGVGWGILLVGGATMAYFYLSSSTDAEVPIYSIGIYSAEEIKGMCDDLL
jgi:hypothetical protein